MSDRVRLLYILGTTRSGSTILERVLGAVPGTFAAGEVHWMWRGIQQGFVCGCGRAVRECDVWSEILRRAAGDDPEASEADTVVRWQREARILHTPRLMRLDSNELDGHTDLGRYLGLLRRMYPAIKEVTGASTVVDSSKSPAVATILSRLPEVDLYVVHLVRDPRAFAYSWRRGKPRDGAPEGGYRPGPVRCAGRWVSTNLLAEAVRRQLPPSRSILVRYEDFAHHPRVTTAEILRFAGLPDDDLPFASDDTAVLGSGHTASGNRSRFEVGEVVLRPDISWTERPRDLRRGVVSALTSPWLRRYGYPFRVRGSDAR